MEERKEAIITLLRHESEASHTSDLVAPPTINTKIRCPIFLKSLDACLSTESLYSAGKKIMLSGYEKDNQCILDNQVCGTDEPRNMVYKHCTLNTHHP